MGTELLFRSDSLLRECASTVLAVNDRGGIILDRTVFYANSGGQPGDTGWLLRADGSRIVIATTVYDPADRSLVVHVPAENEPAPDIGETLTAQLDWGPRHQRMRVHSALHLLSVVLPFPVTGGAIGNGEGRLDFDIQDAGLDKGELTAQLQSLVDRAAPITDSWITDAELDANPGLVKTLSVQPPRGSGRIRLVEIAGIDLQPCGGTHVSNTSEIGTVTITEIEKKGKQNRRVRISLS